MKKNKLFAAVCSAAVTLSLAVCSVPASALSREDFLPKALRPSIRFRALTSFSDLPTALWRPSPLQRGEPALLSRFLRGRGFERKKALGKSDLPFKHKCCRVCPVADPYRKRQFRRIHIQRRQDVTDELNLAQFSSSEFSPVKGRRGDNRYRLQAKRSQSLGRHFGEAIRQQKAVRAAQARALKSKNPHSRRNSGRRLSTPWIRSVFFRRQAER